MLFSLSFFIIVIITIINGVIVLLLIFILFLPLALSSLFFSDSLVSFSHFLINYSTLLHTSSSFPHSFSFSDASTLHSRVASFILHILTCFLACVLLTHAFCLSHTVTHWLLINQVFTSFSENRGVSVIASFDPNVNPNVNIISGCYDKMILV